MNRIITRNRRRSDPLYQREMKERQEHKDMIVRMKQNASIDHLTRFLEEATKK